VTVIAISRVPTLPRDWNSWSWKLLAGQEIESQILLVPDARRARARAPSCGEIDAKPKIHQPIINFRNVSCLSFVRGLVKISAQLRLRAILVIVMWPARRWSLK